MAKYVCRFLNKANRIDDVEMINTSTDQLAELQARKLFAKSDFPGVELFLDGRLIFRGDKAA
jgi:hypothetical protein